MRGGLWLFCLQLLLRIAQGEWRKCPALIIDSNDCSKPVYVKAKFGPSPDSPTYKPFEEPVAAPHSLRLLTESGLRFYPRYTRAFYSSGEGCAPYSPITNGPSGEMTASLARSLECPSRDTEVLANSCDANMAVDHIPAGKGTMFARFDPPVCAAAPCRFSIEMCSETACQLEWLRGERLAAELCAAPHLALQFWLLLLPLALIFFS